MIYLASPISKNTSDSRSSFKITRSSHWWAVEAHTFNTSREVEAGWSLCIQGQPDLPSEFQDVQGYRETLSRPPTPQKIQEAACHILRVSISSDKFILHHTWPTLSNLTLEVSCSMLMFNVLIINLKGGPWWKWLAPLMALSITRVYNAQYVFVGWCHSCLPNGVFEFQLNSF